MSTERPLYPGGVATAVDLLRLADEYHRAAVLLATLGRRGQPISRAPYRFAAIHALELYLSALLIHLGHMPSTVRGLQHDLAARADRALGGGLSLRKRTDAHLRAMAAVREYQVSRYDPQVGATLSQVNRLAATLEEVATKARAIIRGDQKSTCVAGKARADRATG